ncbi:hypothetical protein RIVM261_051930 [Rivularia sp. IAM M-261]|mgnify:CR=1 FL=1|nr:hypothetical protein RIVM261_051930 [Rivularia sp. IAM M-261]
MTCNSKDLEVNDIPIEIWLPDLIVVPVPENKPGTNTYMQIDLHLTNNARTSFRFNPKKLILELITSDGQILPQLPDTNEPSASFLYRLTHLISNLSSSFKLGNYLIVQPRKTATISINIRLFWQNNLLTLEFHACDFNLLQYRHYWFFDKLHPGKYQIRFNYLNSYKNIVDSDGTKVKIATELKNIYLVQPLLTERNIIEVDGIQFETIVPEKIITIPKQERGAETLVKLGMSITNNTQTPFRFDLFATLIPQIVGADGLALQKSYSTTFLQAPRKFDFPFAMPRESVTLFPSAKLMWLKRGRLGLKITAGDGGDWHFCNLEPGIYRVRFIYSKRNERAPANPKSTGKKSLEWICKNTVPTPFVEICLSINS